MITEIPVKGQQSGQIMFRKSDMLTSANKSTRAPKWDKSAPTLKLKLSSLSRVPVGGRFGLGDATYIKLADGSIRRDPPRAAKRDKHKRDKHKSGKRR